MGHSLKEYIRNFDANGKRFARYIGYNQMAWDLGLPSDQFKNMSAVKSLVSSNIVIVW